MGKDALAAATSGGSAYDYSGFIYMAVVISLLSLVFAGISCKLIYWECARDTHKLFWRNHTIYKKVLIVMKFPETMIKISLVFVVVLAGIWALMAFMSGSIVGGVIGLLFFGISVWYAKVRY